MSETLKFWMQLGGGAFYLLNKVFFSFKERSYGERSRLWSIWAWIVYIIGLPFWLVILAHEKNWMVVFVEAGGLPAMLLGLLIAMSKEHEKPTLESEKLKERLDNFARWAAAFGILVSLVNVGLMSHGTQWAELGVAMGFLIGTYQLAHNKLEGYRWFFLMNASAGTLMFMQGYTWLGWQQVASLLFVIDAYRFKRAKTIRTT